MKLTEFYKQLQTELVTWAESIAAIRAIVVVGSQVRQIKPADEYSDLDLTVFVNTKSLDDEYESYLRWMRCFAPIWMIVDEHHDKSKSWLILYGGGIKVDFAVTPITELYEVIRTQQLWDDMIRGYRFLLDKDDISAKLPPSRPFDVPPYTPPTQVQFQRRVENFFLWSSLCCQTAQARQPVESEVGRSVPADVSAANARMARACHSYRPGGYLLSRGFHARLGQRKTWQELHHVFAHFDAENSWDALFASIRLFTRLAEEISLQLDYTYPHGMIDEVVQYIQALYDTHN